MSLLPELRRLTFDDGTWASYRDVPGPAGSTPVVLLHGWGATSAMWWPCFETLAQSHRVLAFDVRGCGGAMAASRPGAFLAESADDVARSLQALGIDRAVIAGYSMGGPWALTVAERHPEMVAGLVAFATAHRLGGTPPIMARPDRHAPRTIAHLVRDRLRAATAPDPRRAEADAELKGNMRRNALTLARYALVTNGFDGTAAARTVAERGIPAVQIVTMDDQLVDVGRQSTMALLTGATAVPIRGDHMVLFEDPQGATQRLADACDAVSRGARPATVRLSGRPAGRAQLT